MPRKKKHREPEYSLHVFHHVDDRTQKTLVVLLVQTIKEFTSFNYEILLDVSIQDRVIRVKILGLRTTPLIMPGIGPAKGYRELPTLRGTYTMSLMKLDGATNDFQLEVTPSRITVQGSPQQPFILASGEPVHFQRS